MRESAIRERTTQWCVSFRTPKAFKKGFSSISKVRCLTRSNKNMIGVKYVHASQ